MHYPNIRPAVFLRRENRFTAALRLPTGEEIAAHVRTTGRCAELFRPGVPAWVQYAPSPVRKTAYTLITVEKAPGFLVNVDSLAPNRLFAEAVTAGAITLPAIGPVQSLRPEVTVDRSRLDFLVTGAAGELWCELKGVTLERGGAALFPDAPTERGLKHLAELTDLAVRGRRTAAVFLIAMEPVTRFSPNTAAQPAFAQALREAKAAGVELLAYRCRVTPDSLSVLAPVPVLL